MRALFNLPQGVVFVNNAGEKYFLNDDEFSPTDIETEGLDQINFDITVQGTVDNAQTKLNEIKAEIADAIANFE
jgi:hypothetical protein